MALRTRVVGFRTVGFAVLRALPTPPQRVLHCTFLPFSLWLTRRYPDPSMARYVLEHHRVRVDAAVMPEALARYVNHRRRRPQLAQTVSSMEVHALSPFVHFEQVRMIEAGEQIFVDYGKEYFVDAQGQPIERGFNYE